MISPFSDKNTRNALVYNGYTFNQEIGGNSRDIVEVNRVVTQTVLHAHHEAGDFADGLETYSVFKRGKRITMYGIIRASTRGGLYDRVEEFAAAIDPVTVSRENADTFGQLALDFNVPTADTANFPTELMACRYYCRAENALEPPLMDPQGLSVPFAITFLASDPRRYLQAASTLSGAGVADNSIGTFYSWPTVTITMSGAGSADFAISNAANGRSLGISLDGRSNGQVVVIDMFKQTIEVDGVDAPHLHESGEFWPIEPGSNTISMVNTTNTTVSTVWRPAFSY